MPNVEKITKQTENPFVNLYLVEGTNKVNHHFRYYVASRANSIEQMKIKTRKNIESFLREHSNCNVWIVAHRRELVSPEKHKLAQTDAKIKLASICA